MSAEGIAGDALGAIGDLFSGFEGASGYEAAASAYGKAAQFAEENAGVATRSGVIQEQQANREIYSVVSGQSAVEAGEGLSGGGSNQYLARASLQQGGLQKAIIANNTQLQVQGFEAEAAADIGQEKQAEAQAQAKEGGGILGALGNIVGIAAAIF